MAKERCSKHKVAPEKKRSESNQKGGQRALNEPRLAASWDRV